MNINKKIQRMIISRNEAPAGSTVQKMMNKELDFLYNIKYKRN